jgi:hypothetical protein
MGHSLELILEVDRPIPRIKQVLDCRKDLPNRDEATASEGRHPAENAGETPLL